MPVISQCRTLTNAVSSPSDLELLTLPDQITTARLPTSGTIDYTIHVQLAGVGQLIFSDNKTSIIYAPGTIMIVATGSTDYPKISGPGFQALNIHFGNLTDLGPFEKVGLGNCESFVSLVPNEVSRSPL